MNLLGKLKEDINFMDTPKAVIDYIWKHSDTYNKYVSWLCTIDWELVQRTWAYRTVGGVQKIVEVERKTPGEELAVRRNIYFTQMGGYHPVYEPKTVQSKSGYYGYGFTYFDATTDWNIWHTEKAMGLTTKVLNCEFVFELDKYKYCGYSGAEPIISYLRNYEKNPKVEYFGKMGIRYSKKIEQKIDKDKQFLNWLRNQNPEEINLYGVSATIYAYDKHISIKEAKIIDSEIRTTRNHFSWAVPEVKGTKIDVVKLKKYIDENKCGNRTYNDYLKAIKYLNLDLDDTKNVFPKDFVRMHDLRINEYNSAKIKEDSRKRKAFTKKFKKVANEYSAYAIENDEFVMLLPQSPHELVIEGNALHHCVGKMGYDKKMADRQCLIGFIRLKSEPNKPFVTCEYLFGKNIISQVYADHDSKPPQEVREFAEEWGKVLTNALKKKAV